MTLNGLESQGALLAHMPAPFAAPLPNVWESYLRPTPFKVEWPNFA